MHWVDVNSKYGGMDKYLSDIVAALPMEGSGHCFSTAQVRDALAEAGSGLKHTSTVQRALLRLQKGGHIEGLLRGRKLYWCRRAQLPARGDDAASTMSLDEAIALQTLRRFPFRQVASLVARSLAPMFEAAERRLAEHDIEIQR